MNVTEPSGYIESGNAATVRKLSRDEACLELALRIWPDAAIYAGGCLGGVSVLSADLATNKIAWNPFKHRQAAIDVFRLVQTSLVMEDAERNLLATFLANPHNDLSDGPTRAFELGVLATPEQITLAACAALGLKVEEESNE